MSDEGRNVMQDRLLLAIIIALASLGCFGAVVLTVSAIDGCTTVEVR